MWAMSIFGIALRNCVGNLQASVAAMFGIKSKTKGIAALLSPCIEQRGKYVTQSENILSDPKVLWLLYWFLIRKKAEFLHGVSLY